MKRSKPLLVLVLIIGLLLGCEKPTETVSHITEPSQISNRSDANRINVENDKNLKELIALLPDAQAIKKAKLAQSEKLMLNKLVASVYDLGRIPNLESKAFAKQLSEINAELIKFVDATAVKAAPQNNSQDNTGFGVKNCYYLCLFQYRQQVAFCPQGSSFCTTIAAWKYIKCLFSCHGIVY